MKNVLICPECGCVCENDCCICPSCGHIFDENVEKLKENIKILVTSKVEQPKIESINKPNATKKYSGKEFIIVCSFVIGILLLIWQIQLKINYDYELELYNQQANQIIEAQELILGFEDLVHSWLDTLQETASDNLYPDKLDIQFNTNYFLTLTQKYSYKLKKNTDNIYYEWTKKEIYKITSSDVFSDYSYAVLFHGVDNNGNNYLLTNKEAVVTAEKLYIALYDDIYSIKHELSNVLEESPPPVNNSIFK